MILIGTSYYQCIWTWPWPSPGDHCNNTLVTLYSKSPYFQSNRCLCSEKQAVGQKGFWSSGTFLQGFRAGFVSVFLNEGQKMLHDFNMSDSTVFREQTPHLSVLFFLYTYWQILDLNPWSSCRWITKSVPGWSQILDNIILHKDLLYHDKLMSVCLVSQDVVFRTYCPIEKMWIAAASTARENKKKNIPDETRTAGSQKMKTNEGKKMEINISHSVGLQEEKTHGNSVCVLGYDPVSQGPCFQMVVSVLRCWSMLQGALSPFFSLSLSPFLSQPVLY